MKPVGTKSEIKDEIKKHLSKNDKFLYDLNVLNDEVSNFAFKCSDKLLIKVCVQELIEEKILCGTIDEFWWNPDQESENDLLKKEIDTLKAELKKRTSTSNYLGVQLFRGKKVVKTIKEKMHSAMPRIIKLATARKNVMLFGPSGCGKTFIAKQLSRCLDLPFGSISFSGGVSESRLEGSVTITETSKGAVVYVPSEFVKIYETGGVFLFDEMDGADPNMLLVINAALANKEFSLGKRSKSPVVKQHKDFICIATANTAGTNADRLYSGRNKLDAATLDRFQIGKIKIDYDREIEKFLCPNENLLKWCWQVREGIEAHRVERIMSTRFIEDSADMVENYDWTIEEVSEAFFCGWREEEISKVKSFVRS